MNFVSNHLGEATKLFNDGCERTTGMRLIFEYLSKNTPAALNCDDILRSSLVLTVSSLDLLIHDIFRLEVLERFSAKSDVRTLRVPFTVLVSIENDQRLMLDKCIREENSYKSFVAPDKLAQCLTMLVDEPWKRIAQVFNEKPETLKSQLKKIVDVRNRIAHEADVNPTYGGIGLWPIYSEDVQAAISFIAALGNAIAGIVSNMEVSPAQKSHQA